MTNEQEAYAKKAADIGRCEANRIDASDDLRQSNSALKKGLNVAALGAMGLAVGSATGSNVGELAGGALAAGGVGAIILAGTRRERDVLRYQSAEANMQHLQRNGITLPTKEAPYFVLQNGTRITPDQKYLDLFVGSEEPSSERGR